MVKAAKVTLASLGLIMIVLVIGVPALLAVTPPSFVPSCPVTAPYSSPGPSGAVVSVNANTSLTVQTSISVSFNACVASTNALVIMMPASTIYTNATTGVTAPYRFIAWENGSKNLNRTYLLPCGGNTTSCYQPKIYATYTLAPVGFNPVGGGLSNPTYQSPWTAAWSLQHPSYTQILVGLTGLGLLVGAGFVEGAPKPSRPRRK